MGKSEELIIHTGIIAMVSGLVAGCVLTANADPVYPHKPIIVGGTDVSSIHRIEVNSETIEAVETVITQETSTPILVNEPETKETKITNLMPEVEPQRLIETEPPEPERELYLTEREKQLLAQLVHSEAGIESYEVMRCVVDVVLNRVDNSAFPNTIEEVIYQPGQFSVIHNGSFDKAAYELTEDDWIVVDEECYRRMDYEILYFNDDSIGGCANGKDGWKIGRMWFSY